MADFDFKAATPVTSGVTSSYYLFGAQSQAASTPDIFSVGAAVGSSTATFTNKTFDTAGTGNSFSIASVAVTANTGTGAVARAASPTFTTPTLGAASATSINGLTITSSTGTLTIANSKTLTVSNILTFTGTDSSTVAFGAGGTVLYASSAIPLTVGTTTIASGTNTRILYDNSGVLGEYTLSGSGTVVAMATSPSFTTPTLGVASATSINRVALTAPATGSTLTIADGKTLTSSVTMTLQGGDAAILSIAAAKTLTASVSMTLQGGDASVLSIAAGKTLTCSNILTFTGTDSSSVAFGTGGTVLYTSSAIPLTVGTTTIASGTNTRILYDNSGVLGEYTLTGTGTVVAMQTAPTFATSITTPAVLATANDSGALGASGTAFADLFLASGGVINWAAANATITHSSGLLTFNVPITLGTSNSFTCGTIEIGAASDTTITRAEAGVIAVEGVPLYSNIPVNPQSADYPTVLADAQKQILHPTADNNPRTFTIVGALAYPVGSAITFVNQINTVTIAISTDTLVFAGAGTTGSRTLAASGIATALKIASGTWLISGTGLT